MEGALARLAEAWAAMSGLELVAVLLVLVVIGLVAVYFYMNSIVKTGVERAGEYALGVKTELNAANVAVFSGNCKLDGLTIRNPSGDWDSDHFFKMDGSEVAVTLGSLREETVEVPLIALSGISMNLERKGKASNYQAILDHLKKFESDSPETKEEKSGGKKFIVKTIRIEDVQVTADLLPIGGSLSRTKVNIPLIELKDVGSDTDNGVVLAQLTDVVMKAIFDALLNNGVDLPLELVGELKDQLAQLENLDQLVGDMSAEIGETTKKVIDDAGKVVEDVTKNIGDVGKGLDKAGDDVKKGLEDVTKGIGGLIPGKKDSSEE